MCINDDIDDEIFNNTTIEDVETTYEDTQALIELQDLKEIEEHVLQLVEKIYNDCLQSVEAVKRTDFQDNDFSRLDALEAIKETHKTLNNFTQNHIAIKKDYMKAIKLAQNFEQKHIFVEKKSATEVDFFPDY